MLGSHDYDLLAQLGKGSQGVVWRAKRKADGIVVAVKQIMLRTMSRREQADAAQEVDSTIRAHTRHYEGIWSVLSVRVCMIAGQCFCAT